jgi:hypothetical protein
MSSWCAAPPERQRARRSSPLCAAALAQELRSFDFFLGVVAYIERPLPPCVCALQQTRRADGNCLSACARRVPAVGSKTEPEPVYSPLDLTVA